MQAVALTITGLDIPRAIVAGRAAAMPKMAEWVKQACIACIANQRTPWGDPWPPTDDGRAALSSLASKIRAVSTDTSWDVVIDDEHATALHFGRRRKGTALARARRGTPRARTDGSSARTRATSRIPARSILPTRVVNNGRSPPRVDLPPEWARALDEILDAEIQAAIDAISRAPIGNAPASAIIAPP